MTTLAELAKRTTKAMKEITVSVAAGDLRSDVKSYISTGWTLLDAALNGGIPVGRVSEIYGKEQAGKSSLCFQLIRECQKAANDAVAIYLDAENTFDKRLATRMGVDLERVLVVQEGLSIESLYRIVKETTENLRSDGVVAPILIVWDTLAATPTSFEDDKNKADSLHRAKMIHEIMRMVTPFLPSRDVALVIVNHVHEQIARGPSAWGGPQYVSSGGMGVKYASSTRIFLSAAGKIDTEDKTVLGHNVRARVDKNKLSAPKSEVMSRLMYGFGFDDRWSVWDYLKDQGVIEQKGAWATLPGPNGDVKTQAGKYIADLESTPGLWEHLREVAKQTFLASKPGEDEIEAE